MRMLLVYTRAFPVFLQLIVILEHILIYTLWGHIILGSYYLSTVVRMYVTQKWH